MSAEQNSHSGEVLHAAKSRRSIKEKVSRVKKKYDLFLYQHGRTVADIATEARLVGGALEAGLVLADFRRAAQVTLVANAISDVFDGHAARKHKHGGTADGARRDQLYDKQRSFMVEAALVARGRMNWRHMALRVGSDIAMNNVVRPYFAKRGIDTKAGWAGKASTSSVTVAEFTAESDSNPQSVQNIATSAKVGRVPIYAAQWGIELWKRNKAKAGSKAR